MYMLYHCERSLDFSLLATATSAMYGGKMPLL
uniref:Uncharacterized protein n=1 Tax=Anguilla anguilla TaxID=7936 RepID=A0A0E9QG13_ANGAN